jgi:hypothetical protein
VTLGKYSRLIPETFHPAYLASKFTDLSDVEVTGEPKDAPKITVHKLVWSEFGRPQDEAPQSVDKLSLRKFALLGLGLSSGGYLWGREFERFAKMARILYRKMMASSDEIVLEAGKRFRWFVLDSLRLFEMRGASGALGYDESEKSCRGLPGMLRNFQKVTEDDLQKILVDRKGTTTTYPEKPYRPLLAVLDPAKCVGHFTGALVSVGKDYYTVHNVDTNYTGIKAVKEKFAEETKIDKNGKRWPLPSWKVSDLRRVAELLDPSEFKDVLDSFNKSVESSGESRAHFDEHVWHHDQVKAGNCPHFQIRVLLIQALGHILLDLQMPSDTMRGHLRELKHFLKHDALLSIRDFLEQEDAAQIIATDYMKGDGQSEAEMRERIEKLMEKYNKS